jgi:hypothetical protein
MPESEPERVTIAGREFERGAIYAPRCRAHVAHCRRLIAFEPAEGWRGGKVTVQVIGRARLNGYEAVSGSWWARWAGNCLEYVSIR